MRAERTKRYPIKTWADLEAAVGADKLAGFESAMNQEEVLVSGLAYGGSLYLKALQERGGTNALLRPDAFRRVVDHQVGCQCRGLATFGAEVRPWGF